MLSSLFYETQQGIALAGGNVNEIDTRLQVAHRKLGI